MWHLNDRALLNLISFNVKEKTMKKHPFSSPITFKVLVEDGELSGDREPTGPYLLCQSAADGSSNNTLRLTPPRL